MMRTERGGVLGGILIGALTLCAVAPLSCVVAPLPEQAAREPELRYLDDIPQLLEKAAAARIDRNKWLFVIGVEKYRETNDIVFSRRSAELFAQVASKTLGIAEDRSTILLDDAASSGAIEDNLKRLLQDVESEDSIYFYFSGHGMPVASDNRERYILPADKIPEFIGADPFYRVANIYKLLQESRARQAFAFMDTCFTGSADGRPIMPVAGIGGAVLRPKTLRIEEANGKLAVLTASTGSVAMVIRPKTLRIEDDGKLAVLTACTESQYSGAYWEKGHRMFSYFLMRELLVGHRTFGDLAFQVQARVVEQTKGSGNLIQNPVVYGKRDLEL